MKYLKVIISLFALYALTSISYAQNMNVHAPEWVNPNKPNPDIGKVGYEVYTVSSQNPLLQWTPPIVSSVPATTFAYDLRIVELVEGQTVDYIMEHAPVFFKKDNLIVPQILVPANVITKFLPNHLYAVQVIARQRRAATPFGSNSVTIPPTPGPIIVFQVQFPKSSNHSN